jgi:hypothetical protein
MYRKGFSVATIGIFLVSILAIFNPAAAVVPAPLNYQLEEYAWLKEDGVAPETWAMYNNTGWNRLNLSFKFSKVNIAYVARSDATSDDFNVTFCVIYNDTVAGTGFNSTGHTDDFPGTLDSYWNRTVPAISTQTAGLYTYHLFVTTYDPAGVAGMYQVRINETLPSPILGSSWTDPDGTVVEWMFFYVPTAAGAVSVTDQLGRTSPFYLDGDTPSTQYNATMLINPPGNNTGASTATIEWLDTDGSVLWVKSDRPIYYIPGQGWATQWVIAANTSFTPFNATHPYGVRITMGAFVDSATFFVLSTQWISVDITVEPTDDQWFDPSSFLVTFTAIVNTGVAANPYTVVSNLTLQFWDKVHYDLEPSGDPDGVPEWYLAVPLFANLSWDITGYPVVSGSSYTYTYTKMIPGGRLGEGTQRGWIDNTTTGLEEFFGWYSIKSQPSVGMYPATMAEEQFYVDDPIEGYTSIEKASTVQTTVFEQKPATIWANAEFDPIYLRSRQHDNAPYEDDDTNITWYWSGTSGALILPPGNDQTTMTEDPAWPSEQPWAFSTTNINATSWSIGTYHIVVNATADTGYVVREDIVYTIVYKAIYLEIWPLWDEYEPCMKKTIYGKTYYLDEDDNEVPVPWGFYIFKLVDPNGAVHSEALDWNWWDDEGEFAGFPATQTDLTPDETEALGAIMDEIPSDAPEGTWTVYAMVLGSDFTDDEVQTIDGYSFQGPVTTTFEVAGSDLHLVFGDILDSLDENFNLTWEVLADVLANQDDMAMANEEDFAAVMAALEDIVDDMVAMGADIDSINDYVREIRALTQRIDRWRTESAEAMVDHIDAVLDAIAAVNDRVNGMWGDVSSQLQVGFYGLNPNDPRSMTKKIDVARAAVIDAVTNALVEITSKVDVVEASLGAKILNVLNAVNAEVGGLDDSMKAALAANVEYIISNIRAKIDDSEAGLSGKIKSSTDALHGKFAGVISEIGYVSNKVDAVEAKLGGVESNVGDKVDAVDASVGTKLLVAIILIVIVLILVLLPIVAPGFRMKE